MNRNFFLNGCNILLCIEILQMSTDMEEIRTIYFFFSFRINLELEWISFLSFCLLVFIFFSTKLEAYNKPVYIFKYRKKEDRTTNLISWPQIMLKRNNWSSHVKTKTSKTIKWDLSKATKTWSDNRTDG